MRDPAELFRALGDETRLYMLALIQTNGELCVCDLVNVLEIGQSKASRHLRYLLNAGLVADRRAGVWTHYSLSDDLKPPQQAVLQALPELLDTVKLAALERKLTAWQQQKGAGMPRSQSCASINRVES